MTTKTLSFDTFNPGSGFTFNSAYALRFHPVYQEWRPHNGGDFSAAPGTPLKAAADGVVFQVLTKRDEGYGYAVVLKHTRDDGSVFYSLQGHMRDTPSVKEGQLINAGDQIGVVGSTGTSTGPHLHFEIIPDQTAPLAKGHATENPATFTDWGNLPHMIGTDSAGNALIAKSSGSIQDGDYSRIVLVKDKATGAVLDTYGQTFTAIKNSTGETEAFRITNKTSAGQDIVIDTVTPNGETLRHEVLTSSGQPYYVRQNGIDLYTTADGSRQAYIAGVDGPIPVGADGRISLSTDKGPITFELPASPLSGGTCSAGGQTYQLKPGESVGACFGGVMIQGAAGKESVTDTFIDGTGKGLRFDYDTDPFQFGDSGDATAGWKLASVDPVVLSNGTMTDVPPGLFSYDAEDFHASGNSQTGNFILNLSDTSSSGDIAQRTIIAGDGHGVSQATIGYDEMIGFRTSNDAKQSFAAGETDHDQLYAGAGRDFVLGGLGNDAAEASNNDPWRIAA